MFAQDQSYNDLEFVFQFESAQSNLPDDLVESLLAEVQTKPYNVFIHGHTDADGSLTYNQQLSEERVQYIQRQLEKAGINNERIQTKAYGETQPIASNQTTEGKQLNRRVSITLSTKANLNEHPQEQLQKQLIALLGDGKQFFDLDRNQQAQTVVGKQGTQVHIPADAFDNPNNQAITLALTEVYKPSDMIVHNLTTTSHQQQLVTGGMLKVEAFIEGQAVQLKNDKKIKVYVPTNKPTTEMQLFDAEQVGTATNWINPRAVQIAAMPNAYNVAPSVDGRGRIGEFNWEVIPNYLAIQGRGNRPKEVNYPVYKDSSLIVETQEELDDRKNNPWKFFKGYKTKKFLFWSIKVKANSPKDSAQHLKRMGNIAKNLERRIERYSNDLKQYKEEFKKYQQYKEALATYDNWETYSDSLSAINLKTAIQFKSRNGINRFSKHLPSRTQYQIWMDLYEIDDIHFMKGVFNQPQNYQDSLYCSIAMANQDTFGINLLKTERYKQKLMMSIYKTKTPLEAHRCHDVVMKRVHLQQKYAPLMKQYNVDTYAAVDSILEVKRLEQAERYRKQRYENLMLQYNVNSYAAVDSVLNAEKIKRQEIYKEQTRQQSYVAELSRMGTFINCDYFPKIENNLIVGNARLTIPLLQTKTFMIFEDYRTVMPAYPSHFRATPSTSASNRCRFINIPQDTPVKVVSFYWDDQKQAHLAIRSTATKEKLPQLTYKSVSDEELKLAIRGLD